jgi:glycolate oxidase FAD binding subunit
MRRAVLVRACGVLYLSLMGEQEDERTRDALARMTKDTFALVEAKQGHAALPHAPPGLKQQLSVWGPTAGDFSIMKKVKQAFDPDGVFAPGRYVGGL